LLVVAGLLLAGGILGSVALAQGRLNAPSFGRGMMGGTWGNSDDAIENRGWGMMGGALGNADGLTCDGDCTGRVDGEVCDGTCAGVAGRGYGNNGTCDGTCDGSVDGVNAIATLADARAALDEYVVGLNNANLEIEEVMEFENNYYAVVVEKDTGIGAMELLVHKANGAVRPEMGPNMMWNTKYATMGRGGRMGRGRFNNTAATAEMTLSAQEASVKAQAWLDENLPGRNAGTADPFYGYYTFHFLKDGQLDGMLSVNGTTGAVWYHSWHGAFVAE
jgi:hypothetical protein